MIVSFYLKLGFKRSGRNLREKRLYTHATEAHPLSVCAANADEVVGAELEQNVLDQRIG